MECIVDEYRAKKELRPEAPDPQDDIAERGGTTIYDSVDVGLNAEAGMLWSEVEREIVGLFDGKEHARAVLRGLMKGETPGEICRANGLTSTQYDSARKAIARERSRIHAIMGRKGQL
jgi:hypothetical protein